MMKTEILILISLAILGIALMPFVIKFAIRFNFTDKPNERKVHNKLMPRLGGLGIVATFLIGLILFKTTTNVFEGEEKMFFAILIGSLIIALLGMIDDKLEISPKVKLLGQVVAASVVIYFGMSIELINIPFTEKTLSLGILAIPITIFWIVGITNAVNLVDGLDGLAGGVTVIAASSIAIIAFLNGSDTAGFVSLLLVASLVGFLIFNFNPAKIFMGDMGSLFLGFILSVMTLQELKQITLVSLIIPIFLLAVPVLDTLNAIVRRKINKRPIFSADKNHLHHQLIKKGLSQKQTVLIIYLIGIFFAGIAILIPYLNIGATIALVVASLVAFEVFARKIGMITENKK